VGRAFKWSAVCLLALAPGSYAIPATSTPVQIGGYSLVFNQYRESLPGRFFFALYNASASYTRVAPTRTTLGVIDSAGKAVFQRSFQAQAEPMLAADFKKIEPGLYGYFIAKVEGLHWPSTYHFLDGAFRDVFAREVPNNDPELNQHEALRLRNGNYLFVFYRDRIQDARIDAEIQEWSAKGRASFDWNSNGRLAPPSDAVSTMDYLHLNSIDQDTDGGLLISLAETSEIVKLSYPAGKILWRMSYRDWKFLNDPLQGFRHQHSVRRLPDGNLLLFDNGGHGREELSRAVEYKIDERARTATLVWEYRAKPGNPFSASGGSVQRLSNGNTLIGWGGTSEKYTYVKGQTLPLFTEVTREGETVRELISTDDEVSYRVYFEGGS
jgi:hypothetical protein